MLSTEKLKEYDTKVGVSINFFQVYIYIQILTLFIIIYLFQKTLSAKLSKSVLALMLVDIFSLFYIIGYIIEHTTQNLDVMRSSIKIEYTGLVGLFIFSLQFYDLYFNMHVKRIVYARVTICYFIILVSVFTLEMNSLFYKSVKLLKFEDYAMIQVHPGILYVIFYLITLWWFLVIEKEGLRKLRTCMAEDRSLCILMMMAPVFPFISILIKWTGLSKDYDLGALGVLGLIGCLTIAIVKYDYFQSVRNEAEIDPLTKVSNRTFFENRVNFYLKSCTSGSFIMIDIDNFKYVNDTFGHAAGDLVLISLCDTLRRYVTDEYCITRMGGDEFSVFLPQITKKSTLNDLGHRLLTSFVAEQRKNRLQCDCTCSIGVAIHEQFAETSFEELYNNADKALYFAKNSGKGQWRFYS